MAIIETLSKNQFVNGFDIIGRGANFTVEAREDLFDFYEDLSDGMGKDVEFDPIAICCDWSEYTPEEILVDFGEDGDQEDDVEYIVEELELEAIVIKLSNGNYLVSY